MSQTADSMPPLTQDPELALQAANDAFVAEVNEQITLGTFDVDDHEALQKLVEGLGDTRGVVRLRFAETLGDLGEPATPFLLEALKHHKNVVVRRAAAKTLTLIADPAAVPTLVESFLNDEDTVVKGSSAGALARTGAAAAPSLLDILASPDHPQDIKGHAAWALAFMGSEAEAYLYKALNSDSLDVRCAVIGALGHVAQEKSDEKSCSLLISGLTDPEPLIRTEAAAALGQINYPDSVPHLILALQDSELDVRKAAINSLGKLGDDQAMDALKAALNDDSNVIRTLAKLAINQIERQAEEDDW
ncbi:MAG: HEAT repeat domain-containing protein [Cyanobacteria bacterium P01_F01_bin.86]